MRMTHFVDNFIWCNYRYDATDSIVSGHMKRSYYDYACASYAAEGEAFHDEKGSTEQEPAQLFYRDYREKNACPAYVIL